MGLKKRWPTYGDEQAYLDSFYEEFGKACRLHGIAYEKN